MNKKLIPLSILMAGLSLSSIAQSARIESTVWNDENANSIQNSNEAKLSGVTVELYNSSNTLISSLPTDGGGKVTFDNLTAGSYYLKYILPSDHAFTPKTSAPLTDNNKSDVNTSGNKRGRTATFSIADNQTINYIDAGLWAPGTVKTTVWDDRNANSVQNSNEPRISGVRVQLLDDNNGDAVLSDVFTDANGVATFNNVPANRPLRLKYFKPADHRFTPKASNPITDNNLSDVNTSGNNNSKTAPFSMTRGSETITYVDAGLWAPGTVKTTVWDDRNANSVQNSNEPKLEGVRVQLLDDNNGDAVLGDVYTDINGVATFNDVPADRPMRLKYYRPADHRFTPKSSSPITDNNLSDVNTSGNNNTKTAPFSLSQGSETITYVDAGLWAPGTVKTTVWDDRNANSVQNSNEPKIAGVRVQLLDDNNGDAVLADTMTDANGVATFFKVPSDRPMRLKYFRPADHKFTPKSSNPINDNNLSDVNTSGNNNTKTAPFSISKGSETITYVDAGLWAPGEVKAQLWLDENANGIKNSNEDGVYAFRFNLVETNGSPVLYPVGHPKSGQPVTALTSCGNGIATLYLPADRDVRLQLDRNGATLVSKGSNLTTNNNSDINTSGNNNGKTAPFRAVKGSETITYVDAGISDRGNQFDDATVQTFVFDDRNANGNHQGEGNFGIQGVKVSLTDLEGNECACATTDAFGQATIPAVSSYSDWFKLKYRLKDGHRFTRKSGNIANDKNNDAKGDGTTDRFRINTGNNINYVEAGMIAPGSLNTFVFDDRNADRNHQGEGNFGIEGVNVQLVEIDGTTPVTYPNWHPNSGPVNVATTAMNGQAMIDYIPADRHVKLKYSLKDGHRWTGKSGNVKNDKNNDAKNDGTTDRFRIERGSENISYVEAGMIAPGTLNTFVFDDRNADRNHQGEGNFGIEAVQVELVEIDGITPVNYPTWHPNAGTPIFIRSTGPAGQANFDYVPADRDVKLRFSLKDGHRWTGKSGNVKNDKNNDVKSDGTTDRFRIERGSEVISYVEGGMIAPGTLNTFIFDDRNADRNHQGEGNFGIDGVIVELVELDGITQVNYPHWHPNSGNPVLASGPTDGSGRTSFDYVPADRDVKLKYVLKDGHRWTGKSGNIKNDKNSDAKSDGTTDRFRIERGSENISYVEAGMIAPGTLNTFVFNDLNADGNHQGEGGMGISSVSVQLVETDGITPIVYPFWHVNSGLPVTALTTGSNGQTSFDYIPADRDVKLKFLLPNNYSFTNKSGNIKNDKNSDAKNDGTTDRFRVERGSELISYVEAGLRSTSSYARVAAKIDETDNLTEASELELNLFPNPTIDRLNITFESKEIKNSEFRVLDHTGKVVMSDNFTTVEGQNRIEIDVNDLPQGNYFVQIIRGEQATVKKFIVLK